MNEFQDLTSRLQALGDNPVPPPVATEHLTAMAAVSAPRSRFTQKVRVVAAFGVGLLVGGTGLGYAAAEGHLPEAAQNGLSVAAEKVGVDLPRGDEKKSDKAEGGGENSSEPLAETVACADGMTHGDYVSSNVKAAREADPRVKGNASELAKSDCGKDGEEGDLTQDLEEESDVDADPGDDADEGKAKGEAKKAEKAENAPETPAGPPADAGDEGDDDEEEGDDDSQGPPSSVPPVETPGGPDDGE